MSAITAAPKPFKAPTTKTGEPPANPQKNPAQAAPAIIPAVKGSEGSTADTARHLLNHLTAAKTAGHTEGVKFYKGELKKLKGVTVQGSDQMEGISNA